MLEADKKEFAALVSATLKTYRVEPDADVLRLWWGALQRFSIEQVRAGFNRFVGSKENKFSIVPANIIEAIEANEPDGRVGAEEAWALYPHDEQSSAVITTEIAEAMRIAQPLIDIGDMIGARMTFKEAYTRIVSQNKAAGVPVKWFPSLGTLPDGREEALKQAVQLGRLTQDHATSLLPAPNDSAMNALIPAMKFLTANEKLAPEQVEKAQKHLANIKAVLGKKAA